MGVLNSLWRGRDFSLPQFRPAQLEFEPHAGEAPDELVLDAVVATIGPELRDAPQLDAMPTAGDLQATIQRHLREVPRSAPSVDAAGELREALAELRRSLG